MLKLILVHVLLFVAHLNGHAWIDREEREAVRVVRQHVAA